MSNNTSSKKNKNVGRLVNIALFLVIIGLGLGIWFSSGIENVTVDGVTRYDSVDFYNRLDHEGIYSNTLIFWFRHNYFRKKDIPFVEKYTVTLIDKNTLSIRVYENEVTGCICIMGSYFCFDRNGVITESTSERPEGVPCVTGLDFSEAVVFKQLNISKQTYFNDVLEIAKTLRKYEIPVSEINFGQSGEVTLYGDNIEVLLGRKKDYEFLLGALKGAYEKASEIGGVLDMRYYSEERKDLILRPYEKEENGSEENNRQP